MIASLNGTTAAGWLRYARLIEQAGADALELNFYHVATDPLEDGAAVERRVVDIVAVLKESIAIPLAVKLSPFYSALPHLAAQLDRIGADGLVLFNRFYQPDIDPERREPTLAAALSDSSELLLRLRVARDSRRTAAGVAGRHRRRARADRRREGRHGGRRRRAAGLGAHEARAGGLRPIRDGVSRAGATSTDYDSVQRDAGCAVPRPERQPSGLRARQLPHCFGPPDRAILPALGINPLPENRQRCRQRRKTGRFPRISSRHGVCSCIPAGGTR